MPMPVSGLAGRQQASQDDMLLFSNNNNICTLICRRHAFSYFQSARGQDDIRLGRPLSAFAPSPAKNARRLDDTSRTVEAA